MFNKLPNTVLLQAVRVVVSKFGSLASTPNQWSDQQLPVTKSRIEICGELYQKLKVSGVKRYRNAPVNGIVAEASYFDNGPFVGERTTLTVLALHGAPGHFNDFSELCSYFTGKGVRVIAPNFPDYSLTRSSNKLFLHTTVERAEFVKAILRVLNVDRVDAVVSHSSGVYTGVELWRDPGGPEVRSLCWLNPIGFEIIPPMKPQWLMEQLVVMYMDMGLEKTVESLVSAMMSMRPNAFSKDDAIKAIHSGMVNIYSNRESLIGAIREIRQCDLPLQYFFSENDNVMPKKLNANLIASLGQGIHDASFYDRSGQLVSEGNQTLSNIKMTRFSGGGHFAYKKYHGIVCNKIEKHLKSLDNSIELLCSKDDYFIQNVNA